VVAQLKAGTVFGALYALETLSQLIQWDDNVNVCPRSVAFRSSPQYNALVTQTYFVAGLPTVIVDNPRYSWRYPTPNPFSLEVVLIALVAGAC
jgi:hypothetical protein